MNNIAITGSEGYIGSRLLKRIVLKEDFNKIITCDLKNGKDIKSFDFGKFNLIFHLAAQSGVPESVQDPINDANQNIIGTLKMIELANKNNAKLIFTTSGAAKKPESPYGLSKKTCEEYIKMLCNDYVILRLSSVFGEKPKGVVDNFIRDKKCFIFGGGEAVRDFVHIDDVIEAIWIASRKSKGLYEIGSGKGVKIVDIAKATGKEIIFHKERAGEKKRVVLKNELKGWSPKINVIDYIEKKCKR